MGDKTGIGWTYINGKQGATWNPIRGTVLPGTPGEKDDLAWACARISPACNHCYAETLNKRRGNGLAFLGQDAPRLHVRTLGQPSRWARERGIFVCSMTDLFWEAIPDAMIDAIWQEMERARQHTYLVLTKRTERMADYLEMRYAGNMVPPHIWVGTTVEDQVWAERRMPHLVRINAGVRWVSYEPALGAVNWLPWVARIDWMIVGGESGPHVTDPKMARRLMVERDDAGRWVPSAQGRQWYAQTLEQCREHGVAVYHKQWGGPKPTSAGCDEAVKEFPQPRGRPLIELLV